MDLPEFIRDLGRETDVSEYELIHFEPLGSKEKSWIEDPASQERYLFKVGRPGTGENWAEVLAFGLAKALGVPTAEYQFATFNGKQGVLSPMFFGDDDTLTLGNELLLKVNSRTGEVTVKDQTVTSIGAAMEKIVCHKPPSTPSFPGVKTALQFFIGYLMLDCLISNQDRHEENWGMIFTKDKTYHLAPTFDHAASLGFNLSQEAKRARLDSKDEGYVVENFVKKAKSYIHSDGKRLRTIEAFEKVGALDEEAKQAWLERLDKLTEDDIRTMVDSIPDTQMTQTDKEFATRLLLSNRSRLLGLRKAGEKQ
jgi:hypothetical protein